MSNEKKHYSPTHYDTDSNGFETWRITTDNGEYIGGNFTNKDAEFFSDKLNRLASLEESSEEANSFMEAEVSLNGYIHPHQGMMIRKSQAIRYGDLRAASDRKEIDELQKKLDFLKSKGLTVGYMKTTDRPEPYLVYVTAEGSEFDETRSVNKVIEAEIERDEARKEIERLTSDFLKLADELKKKEVEGEKASNACERLRDLIDSDYVKIDDLLSEFERRGIKTFDWDGDEGAESAIVDGVENHYAEEIEKLKAALTRIANWDLPATGKFWDREKTQPTSYETEYGSNGARDYIKNIAKEALTP